MEEDAYEVATNYAGAEELIKVKDEYRGKDGKIDMCQALKELLADERMEGVRSVVIRMIQKGKDDNEIMELTGCSMEMLWETRQSMKK